MPPSQLKRLKATLHEHGILGAQQTKKKKKNTQIEVNRQKKLTREISLAQIREQFNPFEYKSTIHKKKFESITPDFLKPSVKRPSLKKSNEEKIRRHAYFEEQKRRNKVGGIKDKRLGENDPMLALEEKMLERFVKEKQQRYRNKSIFDLEDKEQNYELTHLGRALSFENKVLVDDFEEPGLTLSDSDEHLHQEYRKSLKRSSVTMKDNGEELLENNEQLQRKKSKQEAMKELIAKSKLYKYERQVARDEDQDLREELDKQVADIQSLLRKIPSDSKGKLGLFHSPDADATTLDTGSSEIKFDKEYDMRLRQMIFDKKSAPTEKLKTDDELASERARILQELESKRLSRMQGISENADDESECEETNSETSEANENFGLGSGIKVQAINSDQVTGDEDEFIIDKALITSGSDLDISATDLSDSSEDESSLTDLDNGHQITSSAEQKTELVEISSDTNPVLSGEKGLNENRNEELAYQFPCPQSHQELLKTIHNINILDLPTVVRRIRVIYSPKLGSENKIKLANFSVALVAHISYMANVKEKESLNFTVLQSLIRHIHSLAKWFPVEIANAFRDHLKNLSLSRALSPSRGDLIILTAIGTIFSTSDHFHQVATPAMLSMTRYLGLKLPENLCDHAIGSYICSLCLHYQRISRRYVPEVMNFIQYTLFVLAPIELPKLPTEFPHHKPKTYLRLNSKSELSIKFYLFDIITKYTNSCRDETEAMKISLIETNLKLVDVAADIWKNKEAFIEVFQPTLEILQHLAGIDCSLYFPECTQLVINQLIDKLSLFLKQSRRSRRSLELHHHRPHPIRTLIPKFEESFNPDRHYDPDQTRTELVKLKKEHKRERKDVIKQLRKDTRTYNIQNLKEKKERDAAYEEKHRRLVAEIQGEEGREAKAYEREKKLRKKSRK